MGWRGHVLVALICAAGLLGALAGALLALYEVDGPARQVSARGMVVTTTAPVMPAAATANQAVQGLRVGKMCWLMVSNGYDSVDIEPASCDDLGL